MMRGVDRLVRLFHHRWAVPILAAMQRQSGVRFVYLVNGLGIPRDTVARTLNALVHMGLVRRNPGYGHPLRPEYVLSARGARVGPGCVELTTGVERLGIGAIAWNKWTMPIIAVLASSTGHRRFSELQAALPGVTARALALALKEMEDTGLIERRIINEYPPSARYRPAPSGKRLAPILKTFVVGQS
jgi:DNA-binding HxlR family transcriptional regulator